MTLLTQNAGLLVWMFAALLVLRWFHLMVRGAQVEVPPAIEEADQDFGQLSSPPQKQSPGFMADEGRILTAHS